jgi:hypothetical protein
MHLKSILNRVEPLKSFAYREQRLVEVPLVPAQAARKPYGQPGHEAR